MTQINEIVGLLLSRKEEDLGGVWHYTAQGTWEYIFHYVPKGEVDDQYGRQLLHILETGVTELSPSFDSKNLVREIWARFDAQK